MNGFWFFMFVMDLLIPITMIGFGKRYQSKPPKEINTLSGYRTIDGIICLIQIILMIGSIIPTEIALYKTYDINGNRK